MHYFTEYMSQISISAFCPTITNMHQTYEQRKWVHSETLEDILKYKSLQRWPKNTFSIQYQQEGKSSQGMK